MEEIILQRTEQLQLANLELEAFSYSVSHDLRAPLRSINGYSKILEEDYASSLDENGLRILNTIRKNAGRMGSLIDDLLSFSRLGRLEIKKGFINMEDVVNLIINELKEEKFEHAAITVKHLQNCMADNSLIKQVWTNYISNALKYSSGKKLPEIYINSKIENNFIIYSIKDNGKGFNMDYGHKLFNVFQRLHTNKDFEGTGVGIAIVKRIVQKHGGKVWAEGIVNEGATFYFSLPLIVQ